MCHVMEPNPTTHTTNPPVLLVASHPYKANNVHNVHTSHIKGSCVNWHPTYCLGNVIAATHLAMTLLRRGAPALGKSAHNPVSIIIKNVGPDCSSSWLAQVRLRYPLARNCSNPQFSHGHSWGKTADTQAIVSNYRIIHKEEKTPKGGGKKKGAIQRELFTNLHACLVPPGLKKQLQTNKGNNSSY